MLIVEWTLLQFFSIKILILFFLTSTSLCFSESELCGDKKNSPIGEKRGIVSGRVAWAYNPKSTKWDGGSANWWSPSYCDVNVVKEMFQKCIKVVGNQSDESLAWIKIFQETNERVYGDIGRGYMKGDKIAIKINQNSNYGCNYGPNSNSELSPQLLSVLIDDLVSIVGANETDITVLEPSRAIPKHYFEAPQGVGVNHPNVKFVDGLGTESYVDLVTADESSSLVMSNDQTLVKIPQCMSDARCWCPRFMHGGCDRDNAMGSYNPLVDLLGHDDLSGKGLLFIHDGIYAGKTQAPNHPIHYQMHPFYDDYMSSIFVSQDPIAIDSVGFDFLRNEPSISQARSGCPDNYLVEAALADNPPSGTEYKPSGTILSSLGIHEHWNDEINKQYSRNLDPELEIGIELIDVYNWTIPVNNRRMVSIIIAASGGTFICIILLILSIIIVLCSIKRSSSTYKNQEAGFEKIEKEEEKEL